MTDHLFNQLPKAGKRLARIPRFGRLIAGIDPAQLKQIDSNASLLWVLLTYASSTDGEPTTGLLDSGLNATGARTLGWRKSSEIKRTHRKRQWQVRLAMQMLGAIAFEMVCGEDGDGLTPPIDRVQNNRVSSFLNRVFLRIIAAGGYRNSIDQPDPDMVDPDYLDQDWECLKHMNSVGLDYNVFSGTRREILFTDISLRDFFAVYWAVRWATTDDLKKATHWIPDPMGKNSKSQYDAFWDFAIEIETIQLDQDDDLLQPFESSTWERLFSPFYDINQQPDPESPIRSSELIYRSWHAMEGSAAKSEFQSEFGRLLDAGDAAAHSIMTDPKTGESRFIQLADPDNERDEFDTGEFQMGEDEALHHVRLSPFRMNQFCVTNQQFERFAPSHTVQRAFGAGDRNVDEHPVVNVNWYDCWCFATWVGEPDIERSKLRICLPTEAQWEYCCRCGETTSFTWHNREYGDRIVSGDANFDENYPWPNDGGADKSKANYLGRTIAVNGIDVTLRIAPNPWGLHQLHGNVWEWCQDWYAAEYDKADVIDPEGPKTSRSRVLRGGSWIDYGRALRSAYRGMRRPSFRNGNGGFRLAAVPSSPASQVEQAEA